MFEQRYLNEEECLIIINAPSYKVESTGIIQDYMLTEEERLKQAREILDMNRMKDD